MEVSLLQQNQITLLYLLPLFRRCLLACCNVVVHSSLSDSLFYARCAIKIIEPIYCKNKKENCNDCLLQYFATIRCVC